MKMFRRKNRSILMFSAFCLGFLTLWCFLTIAILFLQDSIFGQIEQEKVKEPLYERSNLQVVVGHYNGNLPDEKRKNLTDDELNANNYSPVDGYGENGAAAHLEPKEKLLADSLFPINQFNIYVSDRISVQRTIPDVRKPSCRNITFPEGLPSTSVIIVYHNEAFSTLLRTIWSVVNRSPRHLLEEIILVDDFSTRTFLKYPALDTSLKQLPVHVKIVRAQERVGLIRARMMGAQEATGDVLTFLDSHCECTVGWLEPLLARIKENRKTVPCPVIDIINDNTFQYQKGIELFRGGFNWNLQFRWYSMPSEMAKKHILQPTSPIESPTMAGGLFSIDRRYFEELGEYDPGMDIWGGENLEMSFRIWQCGGRVEILPCSHVGHIFRKSSPHDFPGRSSGKILNQNLLRVAEVWMDEWKDFFYRIAPQALHMRSQVDVSERIELRKKLLCRPFSWYLSNVFTDHFLPKPGDRFGRISSESSSNSTCLVWAVNRSGIKKPSTTNDCNLSSTSPFTKTQLWLYTVDGRIRTDEHLCLSSAPFDHGNKKQLVQLKECAGFETEYWDFNRKIGRITHRKSGLCLQSPEDRIETNGEFRPPELATCRSSNRNQKWTLTHVSWDSHS